MPGGNDSRTYSVAFDFNYLWEVDKGKVWLISYSKEVGPEFASRWYEAHKDGE